MNQKVLWKIESLCQKYFTKNSKSTIDVMSLYKDNISIYNLDFKIVEEFDFSQSENVVHSDKYGEYKGLKNSQVLFLNGKPIYLFDNHNKIVHPFLEYYEVVGKEFDVVHIDAHDDDALFGGIKPQKTEIEKVESYIKKTRISDFFDFVSESNLIKKIHRYTKSNNFEEFKKPENPYILSLDIDIFGVEGDFVDLESKVKIIAKAWFEAEVVCIAMSPGFIDQRFAEDIIKIFIKEKPYK